MSVTPEQNDRPRCELCGEPMPQGEEMFKIHGYSGPCPKPPLPRPPTLAEAARALLDLIDELPEEPGGQQDRVFAAYEFDDLRSAFAHAPPSAAAVPSGSTLGYGEFIDMLAAQPKAPSPTPAEAEAAFARIDQDHVDEQLRCVSCGCDDGHRPTCDMLKVKAALASRGSGQWQKGGG